MWDFIKNSKGEILNLLFKNPEKSFYLREIAKELGRENSPSYVQGALEFLLENNIIKDERIGNLRFFKLNKEYSLYDELKRVVSKTVGAEGKIREIIESLNDIQYAFIFGSTAKGHDNPRSDIDLMLIGLVDQDVLINAIAKVEEELGKEISYHIFTKGEVLKMLSENNSFFVNIFSEPKIILKGNLNEFTINN